MRYEQTDKAQLSAGLWVRTVETAAVANQKVRENKNFWRRATERQRSQLSSL
jgi:hypothetical protein